MQKNLLPVALAACLLYAVGCSKTDLTSDEIKLNNQLKTDAFKTVVTNGCDVIDFERATPNTLLSSVTSAGGVVIPMTSFNSSSLSEPVSAIVFDSDVPHKEDIDLGTPSVLYGGPGNVNGGQSSAGLASNNTALHNIAVIQNFTDYGTRPLVANDDDNRDNTNEYMTFNFAAVGTVTAKSLTVIDVEKSEEGEGGWVILYDVNGVEIKRFEFPETWESGVGVIDLGNTTGVRSIKVEINGSIGIDNLHFCPETPPPPCDIINFENVAAGTLLSSVTSVNGVVVPMTSHNSSSPEQPIAAIVFDSDVPHKEDIDLGTPSVLFGGPGNVNGGQSSAGLITNSIPLHNIVVIQNFIDYGNPIVPNDDDNRDNTNEYITFNFSSVGTVTAESLTVIDVEKSEEGEGGWVILYDVNGVEITRFAFPETWESGVGVIDLGSTPGVRSIRVEINGSIGIDNLEFCPEEQPMGCTYTQGYWKNHGPDNKGNQSNEWPVSSLTLGSVTYTASQLQSILRQPVKGNGLVSLAHQLIAAKLNIANGANGSTIMATIAAADALIGSKKVPPVGSGYLSPSSVSSLVNTLTKFNEGTLAGGPPHCGD